MKLKGVAICFESEKAARQAFSDLEFVNASREHGKKVREGFASMTQAQLDAMNKEQTKDLR